ncbi:hypothetical protein RFI_29897, partial [Reticulomyxa filosa]
AGFGRHEIRQVMEDCCVRLSKDKEKKEMWIFLDEVNTSPDIGWFKELICDHSLDGVKISDKIKVIAACNPYRPRKIQNSEVLNMSDPLSKWMYRVVPLCDTMKEYVWPFGQLSELDEKQYIRAMTKQIKHKFDKNTVITEDIAASQCFLREYLANEFIVSLRDVDRCLNFFYWLMQQYETILENDETSPWTGRALNIALGLCYYFRLDERGRTKLLNSEIKNLSESFEIPPQVALHNTLKENLFILFFCVATSTPMILVGRPGTSKTLSLQIMLDTLSHRNIKQFYEKLKNKFHFN